MTGTRSALSVNATTRKFSIEKANKISEEEAEYQIPNSSV
jgi:hypothetical protein